MKTFDRFLEKAFKKKKNFVGKEEKCFLHYERQILCFEYH